MMSRYIVGTRTKHKKLVKASDLSGTRKKEANWNSVASVRSAAVLGLVWFGLGGVMALGESGGRFQDLQLAMCRAQRSSPSRCCTQQHCPC